MKSSIALLILSFGLWLPAASGADIQSDLKGAMSAFRLDEQRLAAIQSFATSAKAKDYKAMLEQFVPAARQAEGDEEVAKYFAQSVAPFFSAYEKLHNYRTIEPRNMPDGSVGYRYYTYIINTSGEQVPFDIIVMEVDGKSYIANFNARGCITDKHPVCK